MTIKLGDRNETVRRWRQVMAAQFRGYARTVGDLPTNTDEFGARAQAWQQEYERRTNQTVDGVVSDQDLADLKIVLPHRPIWVYTAPGSGAPWWVGPPFDTGEWCKTVLNLNHQPVGYPIGGYLGLMGGDPKLSYNDVINAEGAELERLISTCPDLNNPNVEFWFVGYSQSADGMKVAVERLFGDGGPYEAWRPRINGLLMFGDPTRKKGRTKVGNTPVGWGIARKTFPAWLENLTWSITNESPTPDFYACTDDDIRPLFYEWFVKAETELPFVIYTAQIIIPALLNLIAPFLGGLSGLASPLAVPILAGATGAPTALLGSLIGGIGGTNEQPDPKLIEFLSIKGVLSNLPALIKLLGAVNGIAVHGDYYAPKPEFGGRSGVQVACDVVAGFRR